MQLHQLSCGSAMLVKLEVMLCNFDPQPPGGNVSKGSCLFQTQPKPRELNFSRPENAREKCVAQKKYMSWVQ